MVGRSCSESSGIGPHNDSRGAPYDKNFPVNPSRTLDDRPLCGRHRARALDP
jgi:hypothetical protein